MKYLFLIALLAALVVPSPPTNLVAQLRIPIPECPISGHATCSNQIDDDDNGIVDDAPASAVFTASGSDYVAEFEGGKMAGLIGSVADGAASGGNAVEISSSNTFGAGQWTRCLPATATSAFYRLAIVAKIPDTTNNVVWVRTTPFGHPIDNNDGSVLFLNQSQSGYASSTILDGIDFRNKGQKRATRSFALGPNDCLYVTAMPGIRLDTASVIPATTPPPEEPPPPPEEPPEPPPETPPADCDYYAGPTVRGTGNGSSDANRFLIASFWAVAKPGSTLCLASGTYQGASSMIRPTTGLSGTSGNPITVRASVDGGPIIDGQQARNPVLLISNKYFVLEGFDAKNGAPDAVIRLASGSDNNIIRRVVGWDAYPLNGNTSIFASNGNTGNLWEDIAGFGIARKCFEASQRSNNGVIRRAWCKWERNTRTGPKMAFTMGYNSRNLIFENVIGNWSESGTAVERYGLFAMDGTTDGQTTCYNSKILGSIGYLKSTDVATGWLGGLFGSRSIDCFEFRHVAVLIQGHSTLRPIFAQRFDGGGPAPLNGNPANAIGGQRKFVNVTEIGGAASSINNDPINGWTKTNHVTAASVGAAPSIWNGSGTSGARVCFRYVNGTLTATPLWPWPMNERIKAAHVRAGKASVDVMADLQSMFGAIPAACRS